MLLVTTSNLFIYFIDIVFWLMYLDVLAIDNGEARGVETEEKRHRRMDGTSSTTSELKRKSETFRSVQMVSY